MVSIPVQTPNQRQARGGAEAQVTGKRGRSWAYLGLVGVAVALVVTWAVQFSIPIATYDAGGAEYLEELRSGNNEAIWRISSGIGFIATGATVFFAIGLRRHLASRLGSESATPGVVAASMLITAGIFAVAMSFRAQVFDSMSAYAADPSAHVAVNRLAQDTVLAAWATIGIASAAVAVAGFRTRLLPRSLAAFSAVVTLLIAVLCLAGVPFPANIPALVWLLVMSVWAIRSAEGTNDIEAEV